MVARAVSEFGDVVYDVYLGMERVAWGLTDQPAAERWVARLAAGDRARELGFEAVTEDAGSEDDGVTAGTLYPSRRVWWND